ncbi:MAG: hypothetical protein J7L37_02330 [Thermococcus sp.]|nr:hypothetical protein [Thermococcus sp.]
MKKALAVAILFLMLLPTVSAAELAYYPNQEAFKSFLESNSTYTVIAGNASWARGWAHYVDSKLSTIKERGNDTLVLVGNVENNEVMRELWWRTGLSKRYSFQPSVIVLSDVVFITGNESNIYLTERAFSDLWNPPRDSKVTYLLAFLLVSIILGLPLRGKGNHAGSFYLLTIALIFLWSLNAPPLQMTDSFLRVFFDGLKAWAGGGVSNPLSALLWPFFKVAAPIEENLNFAHWVLVLILASLSFYIAPKGYRELGFLIFGLTFVAPEFRTFISSISGITIGLVAFAVVLALLSNLQMSIDPRETLLKVGVISVFTVFATVINPYVLVIPVAFVLAFPGRPLRNLGYLLISLSGALILYAFSPPYLGYFIHFNNPAPGRWAVFLFQGLPAILVLLYGAKDGGRLKRKRGHTPFLLTLTVLYALLLPLSPFLYPYAMISLSALTARVVNSLTGT